MELEYRLGQCIYFYHLLRSWGKVMFLQASVILLTGGGSASVHAGTPPREQIPQTRHPPRADPPGQAPPSPQEMQQSMLGDTVNARAVRILLECNLVYFYLNLTVELIMYRLTPFRLKHSFLSLVSLKTKTNYQ